MKRRILAIVFAAIMIMALAGCGSSKREIVQLTLSSGDSEAILAAAGITLPDVSEASAAATTVKWFCWYDPFHNYSEDEIINTGYYTFTEKYGCEVEWIETNYYNRNDDLANLILSSQSPDCAPCGTSNTATFPYNCMKGMYTTVDDYVDYTDPLWAGMADAAEYFALGDKHFGIVTDISPRLVCPYNRRVIEEFGFDDPAELFYNDEWTWDVFYNMCVEFSDEDEDRYALDGWPYQRAICEESTGRTIIMKDEDGHFYSNLDDPIIEAAESLLYDLVKNGCTYHIGTNYNAGRNDHECGAGVKEGLCLFSICTISDFTMTVDEMNAVWGDIEAGEIMFVPLPRYQDGDGVYYLNSVPDGYMICMGATNPEGVALLASCERFKIIDPTVIDIDTKQLKEIYMWTDEMLEMVEICDEIIAENTIMFYNGNLGTNLDNAYNQFDQGIKKGATSTWAQLKETYSDQFEYYLDELNSIIDAYIETGELVG